MINYTECTTNLMRDVIARVPELSFIDLDRILVFARYGRTDAEGPYATCHSLNLPTSEPGYFYWRDRETGRMTRRSEWFVTKSPAVTIGGVPVEYLISFGLPRFCEQSLRRSRKEGLYPGLPAWIAKLDTMVHELYHIDPGQPGIRRLERADGSCSPYSHTPDFFETVARLVKEYLASGPDPATYGFLRYSFAELTAMHGGVVALTFRNFPSFPQRYMEPLAAPPKVQPHVKVEPVKRTPRRGRPPGPGSPASASGRGACSGLRSTASARWPRPRRPRSRPRSGARDPAARGAWL
jgi:hypothetical protein